ncbi:MAG: hypothetical protein IJ115_05850 [Erysipelotrichaceae bacterium]|nr:hypothetical protein [Erysipelotrichaceae bacterium]
MRKTAGFLRVLCSIALVFEVLACVILVGVEVFLAFIGNFSDIAAKTGNAITISGGTMTPAEMDAIKPIIMIVIALSLVTVVFAIIGTVKTRVALSECKEERPFSDKCVAALLSAARLQIIGGLIGIVGTVVLQTMASKLTVNGTPIGSSATSFNLTFLVNAVEIYLLYHIAKYGNSLEKRI